MATQIGGFHVYVGKWEMWTMWSMKRHNIMFQMWSMRTKVASTGVLWYVWMIETIWKPRTEWGVYDKVEMPE